MPWVYILLTWFAALFVADAVGQGKMNPWTGLFVLFVLLVETIRFIYRNSKGKNPSVK